MSYQDAISQSAPFTVLDGSFPAPNAQSPPAARLGAGAAPLLLAGDVPRLLDEWQIEPSLWNLVRRQIDSRGGDASRVAERVVDEPVHDPRQITLLLHLPLPPASPHPR